MQGRFLRWLSFTLASVCSMVLAGNLVLFFVAWVLTSFGLHQLLTHYGDRPNAQRVAYKKFVISRLGDAFLIVAIALIYRACGTVEYADLLQLMQSNSLELIRRPELAWSAVFLVLGGLTKSAQFPFHTWLPDTMETPTPVSALMHAGVINAGGYLLIRMSCLVEKFPAAMSILVILGGVTAAIGAAIMLTQTNVKRGLAYSTIAQMGMMMLQCGLGAFSTAFLHIIAHSLYKSNAFLSAGTLGQRSAAIVAKKEIPLNTALGSSASVLLITFVGVMIPFLGLWFQDLISLNKLPLIFIFALAVHALVQQVWVAYRSLWRTVGASLVLGGLFFGMTLLAQWYLRSSLPAMGKEFGLWQGFVSAYVALIFMGLWGVQFLVDYAPKLPLTRKLYAHMVNELYLDLIVHRCIALFNSKQKTKINSLIIGKEGHV
jgi:NAD(P)H-quinone oxidoreductase subunit 5